MSKFTKGVLTTIIVIALVSVFLGIAFVSNWFTLPTEEWGSRWNEIWGTINQSATESPIDLSLWRLL